MTLFPILQILPFFLVLLPRHSLMFCDESIPSGWTFTASYPLEIGHYEPALTFTAIRNISDKVWELHTPMGIKTIFIRHADCIAI